MLGQHTRPFALECALWKSSKSLKVDSYPNDAPPQLRGNAPLIGTPAFVWDAD
ncbi:TPA: hypothetical protein ACRREP_003197 [Acinetobacter baumannii]